MESSKDIEVKSFAEYLDARSRFTKSKYDAWIVEHGREYQIDEDTYFGRRMRRRECFANASRLAMEDHSLTYCEGYVSVFGVPIHHAWVINTHDKVRDPTLKKDPKIPVREYFGVAFSTDYVMKSLLINDTYGLLDGFYSQKTFIPLINGHTKDWRGR